MSLEIVSPDDVRFERLSHGQNARFPATPADTASRIALCDSSEDVAEALERFVHAGLRPTIRSGGNCYEDFTDNNPGGAIIDIGLMTGTQPVANGLKYHIAAATPLGRAYPELYERYLVTLPGGTCAPVCAAGHISGGGFGLLSRLHGITPDWVSAVDVVTINHAGKAQIIRADKRNNSDLLRACRGAGGGSFGVMTHFHFEDLPKAPTEVIRGGLSFSWDSMTEEKFARILYLYSNYWETRGQDKDTWGLFCVFNLSHASSGHLSMSINFTNPDGTVNDTKVLDEYLAMFDECKPIAEISKHPAMALHHADPIVSGEQVCVAKHNLNKLAWIDAQGAPPQLRIVGAGRHQRHQYKSAFLRRTYSPAEAACFYKHLTRTIPGVNLEGNTVLCDSFGGAVNRPEMYEQTSAAQRNSIMKLQFIASWQNPAEDAGQARWLRDFYTELFQLSGDQARYTGTPYWGERYEGCYINYPDADMVQHDFWPHLYYGPSDLYPFLQSVKKKYDPNNVFHHAMSIRA